MWQHRGVTQSLHYFPILLTAWLPALAVAQGRETGSFVTLLGRDTIAVESFTRLADRIQGTRVLRFPRTSFISYTATIGSDGKVNRIAADFRGGAELTGTPDWSATIEFGPAEAITRFTRDAYTETTRIATRPGAVPALTFCYALVEQMVRQSRGALNVRVPIELVYPGQPTAAAAWIVPMAGDSVAISFFHDQAGVARFDSGGRLLSFDAQPTVVKVVVTRGPQLDVMDLARQFAARDSAGQEIGPLSPRDTLRATVGRSSILVDYGRPSKRGRTVFGSLVPWNQVWRTGANAATQFSTSRDLMLGNKRLKAGSYTLWTIPSTDGAILVINAQTGQWGTDYDPQRDVVRIPFVVRTLEQPVERFTIEIVPAGSNSELRMMWDISEWAIMVRE
jgi:hypothetical protein